jgi:tetratricopeptide (TPR) repeat protein
LLFLFSTSFLLPGGISFLSSPLHAQSEEKWIEEVSNPRLLGKKLLEEGLYEQAREMLEQAEHRYPGDPDVRKNLSEVYARLAEQRFERGQYLEAEYFAEQSLKRNPRNPELWVLLGRARLNLNNNEGALSALSEGAKLKAQGIDGYLVEAYGRVAIEAILKGDLNRALASLREAEKRGPRELLVFYGYGRYYLARKEYDRAVTYLEEVTSVERFRAPSLYYLSEAYYALKAWQKALLYAESAVTYPDFRTESLRMKAEIQYRWGEELYRNQQYEDVLPHLHNALELYPDWYEARTLLVRTYLALDDGEKAKEILAPLYRTKSALPEVRRLMASAELTIGNKLVKSGKITEGIEAYRRSLESDPGFGAVWMPLGIAHERLKQYEEAVSAYRQSIAFGLNLLEANERAMRILMDKLHRPLSALDHAEAVLKIEPQHKEARQRIIEITRNEGLRAFQGKDYSLAKRLFLRHRELKQDSPEVNSALAEIYISEAGFRLALPLVEWLMEYDPRSPRYLDQGYRVFLGIAGEAESRKNYVEAEEFLTRALKIRPEESRVRLRLGVAKLHLKKFQEAVDFLHQVERESPELKPEALPPLALALVGLAGEVMMENPTRAVSLTEEAMQKNPRELSAYPVAASAYTLVKNYPRAIEVLEFYLKEVPQDAGEWQRLLSLYRTYIPILADRKEDEKTIAYAQRLKRYAPDDPLALYYEGMAWIHLGRFETAEPLLHRVREIPPYSAPAQLALARGYVQRGEILRATTYYRGSLTHDPHLTPITEVTEVFRKAGSSLEKEGRVTEAVELYRYLHSLIPEDPRANYDYGRTLLKLSRFAESEPYLRKAWELNGKDPDYLAEYARALLALNNPLKASELLIPFLKGNPAYATRLEPLLLESITRAIPEAIVRADWDRTLALSEEGLLREKKNPFFLWAKGKALRNLNKPESALPPLESAYSLSPSDPAIIQELAGLLRDLGYLAIRESAWEKGEGYFSRSLTLETHRSAYEGLVLCARGKGDPEKAYTWLKKLETLGRLEEPWLSYKMDALRELGERERKRKDYPTAISYFQEYQAISPKGWEPLYLLGRTYLEADDPERAVSSLEELEERSYPQNLSPSPRELLREGYRRAIERRLGQRDPDLKVRRKLIQSALSRFPNDPEFLLFQAQLMEEENDPKGSARTLLKILKIQPDHPSALSKLHRLLREKPPLREELDLPPGFPPPPTDAGGNP